MVGPVSIAPAPRATPPTPPPLVRQRCRTLQQISVVERMVGPNPYTAQCQTPRPSRRRPRRPCSPRCRPCTRASRPSSAPSRRRARATRSSPVCRPSPVSAGSPRSRCAPGSAPIERFANAAHLTSHVGFGVREQQSGENRVKGKITKRGDIVRPRRTDLVTLDFPQLAAPGRPADWKHRNKVARRDHSPLTGSGAGPACACFSWILRSLR